MLKKVQSKIQPKSRNTFMELLTILTTNIERFLDIGQIMDCTFLQYFIFFVKKKELHFYYCIF